MDLASLGRVVHRFAERLKLDVDGEDGLRAARYRDEGLPFGAEERALRERWGRSIWRPGRACPAGRVCVQVRMLRQGLTSRPVWVVSLSVPREGTQAQVFDELAVVRVNANTGKVEDVRIQR